MNISVENLGAIRSAKFTLGELTILCGKNNTGKTYLTYALHGFLYFWRRRFIAHVSNRNIESLMREGTIKFDISELVKTAPGILKQASAEFAQELPHALAASEKRFADSEFNVSIDPKDLSRRSTFDGKVDMAERQLLVISKKADSETVEISLLIEDEAERDEVPRELIRLSIGRALKDIVFQNLFPRPFIACTERTGIAVFGSELHVAWRKMLDQIASRTRGSGPRDVIPGAEDSYAFAIKANMEFMGNIKEKARRDSFIAKKHPEVLADFEDIIDGKYVVTDKGVFYQPKGKRFLLTINESSSTVRAMLDIGFYLRHVAQPGDILMVDEPELNLHPENQRRIARLFARLVNAGIKVFASTHSDYIIKELNTLVMLRQKDKRLSALAKRKHYKDSELLDPKDLRVYIAKEALVLLKGRRRRTRFPTLVSVKVRPETGAGVDSFDETIEDMNQTQAEILWGIGGEGA